MANKYALIDLENIQPASLQKLKKEGYRLKVFVGPTQSKINIGLVEEVHGFGQDAEYIRIQNSGKNALDFHIAFYMGQLSMAEPGCQFLVISKDTGYDPLLSHLRSKGIHATRSGAVASKACSPPLTKAAAPTSKQPSQMPMAERMQVAIHHFNKAGKAKPGKLKTLANALASVFQKKLSDQAITDLINALIKQGVVIDNQGAITYKLSSK
ncbi:PIN domain-containing protein [Phytopseudomonas dryadis]|uniref:PIN-like domain-containing protein n=1 Tax=Phytopseudomonas dryadis TaxID=2487520 RepID=A0A4Q9R0E3_9GAMM|nr:PIN domain-containing protein [Pseudomonas dryadis]TBU90890.1 hypothetical protein DNK44_14620 [Pseudomonas dryadis]